MYAVAVITMKDAELNAKHRPAHLDYLAELKRQGRVWVSGPFSDGSGGMVVYRADDLASARAMAEADPLVESGARTLTLFPWQPLPPVAALSE